MFPFLAPADLSEAVLQDLERLVGNAPSFDFSLTRVSEFGQGVVYLEPEPAEPFVYLSGEIGRHFGLLPFAGEFGDVLVPHLTLAMPQLHSATQRIAERLAPVLPIRLHANQAWLMVGDDNHRWTRIRRLPFSGVSLREVTDFFKPSVNVIESPHGFSVEVVARAAFPAVWMRYREGHYAVDVFAEAMAGGSSFELDPSSIVKWSPPHELEPIEAIVRERILERIEAALEFDGYRTDRNP